MTRLERLVWHACGAGRRAAGTSLLIVAYRCLSLLCLVQGDALQALLAAAKDDLAERQAQACGKSPISPLKEPYIALKRALYQP